MHIGSSLRNFRVREGKESSWGGREKRWERVGVGANQREEAQAELKLQRD